MSHRQTRTGGGLRLALLVLALLTWLPAVVGCTGSAKAEMDKAEAPGACVVLTFDPQGDIVEGREVACSRQHTHVVLARTRPGETCPPGTDVADLQFAGLTYTGRCYRANTDPGAAP